MDAYNEMIDTLAGHLHDASRQTADKSWVEMAKTLAEMLAGSGYSVLKIDVAALLRAAESNHEVKPLDCA